MKDNFACSRTGTGTKPKPENAGQNGSVTEVCCRKFKCPTDITTYCKFIVIIIIISSAQLMRTIVSF